MNSKIGIDIGNVLTQRDTDILPFGDDYLDVPVHEGTFEAVAQLAKWFGKENVFLVSKCSAHNEEKSREWLVHKGFFTITGVLQENVFFCETRYQKRSITEAHQLNYFVDDRWSVLRHLDDLDSIKKLYLFNPFPHEKAQFESEYRGDKIMFVESWQQVMDDIDSIRLIK